MIILGVETSCDESGVAIYDTQLGLLGHFLHSQIDLHVEFGGVVPELASRDHIRRLVPLIKQLCQQTEVSLAQIDYISYTQGPGLAGALLVGSSVAHALGFALNKPVIGVHHLEGHLLSPLLSDDKPELPFLALLVSGGHTQLMKVETIGQYELLGESVDDAVGEAFDKTAKLLGLGYPGGPIVSKMAHSGKKDKYTLPRPMLHSGDFNFSFSGLKTAVLNLTQQVQRDHGEITDQDKADICLAFQDAVVEVLSKKATQALRKHNLKHLVIAGGVGANLQLRDRLNHLAEKQKFKVYYPPLNLCTDNGAMIALAGSYHLDQAVPAGSNFKVKPRWDLTQLLK